MAARVFFNERGRVMNELNPEPEELEPDEMGTTQPTQVLRLATSGGTAVAPRPSRKPPLPFQPPPVAPAVPPPPPPPTFGLPPLVAAGTIGQQLRLRSWTGDGAGTPAPSAEIAPVPAALPAPHVKPRPTELLWCADGAYPRLRGAPHLAEALGPPSEERDPTPEASRRAVHRALVRMQPVGSAEQALRDAIDEEGVLTPSIAPIAGELELLVDEAEYVLTLASLARPFVERDGELGERLDSAEAIAQRLPDASDLIARELGALRREWAERDVPIPLEELEAGARRALVKKRRLRTLDIFEGPHVVGLLRTDAHDRPLPVYLPEAARGRLPLEGRFDVRLVVEIRPRQVEDEASPLAAVVLAIARAVRL